VAAFASIDPASGMPVTIYRFDPDGSVERVTRLFSFTIPGVLDHGVDETGRGYLVVPAVTEFPSLEPGTLTETQAAVFGAQALEAMEAAASVGLVHGAICPAVWRRNGEHLLLEGYGLPGLPVEEAYRAPELRSRRDVTLASDIYAWARCLNALVTGAPEDGVPGALANVIEPCLSPDPSSRPSPAEVLPEILALSGQSPQSLTSGRTTESDAVLDLQATDPGLIPKSATGADSDQGQGRAPGAEGTGGQGLELDLGPMIGPPPEPRGRRGEADVEATQIAEPLAGASDSTVVFSEEDFDTAGSEPSSEAPQGSVTVVSEPPGAEVLVDGVAQPGTTPLTLQLRVGVHRVTLRRDGYETKTRDIEIFEGERTVRAVLRPEGVLPPARPRAAARPGSGGGPVTARRVRAGGGHGLPAWAWGAAVVAIIAVLGVLIFAGRPEVPFLSPASALAEPHTINFTGLPPVGIKLFVVNAPAGSGLQRGDQLASLPQSVQFYYPGDYIVRAVLADCTAPLVEFNVPRNRNLAVGMTCP
jgi:hypothetical protein